MDPVLAGFLGGLIPGVVAVLVAIYQARSARAERGLPTYRNYIGAVNRLADLYWDKAVVEKRLPFLAATKEQEELFATLTEEAEQTDHKIAEQREALKGIRTDMSILGSKKLQEMSGQINHSLAKLSHASWQDFGTTRQDLTTLTKQFQKEVGEEAGAQRPWWRP